MAIDYLKTIGNAREALRLKAGSPFEVLAQGLAKKIAAKAAENTPKGSGALANSIQPDVKINGSKIIVEWLANDYWDFVNSGVDGYDPEQPPVAITNSFGNTYSFSQIAKTKSSGTSFKDSIEKWIQSKGIMAEDGDYDSLQFLIMNSIKKKGIPPTQFMDKAFSPETLEQFETDMLNAFANLL